jgi:hypothetical protein
MNKTIILAGAASLAIAATLSACGDKPSADPANGSGGGAVDEDGTHDQEAERAE